MSLPVAVLPSGNVQLANGNVIDGKLIDATSKAANQQASPVQQANGKILLSNGNSVMAGANNTAPAMPQTITANKSSVMMTNGSTVHANNLAQLPAINTTSVVNNAAAVTSSAATKLANNPNAYPADVSTANQVAAISNNHAANVARSNGNYTMAEQHAATALRHLRVAEAVLAGGAPSVEGMMHERFKLPNPFRKERFDETGANIAPPHPTTQYWKPAPFNSVGGAPYFYVGEAYGVATTAT